MGDADIQVNRLYRFDGDGKLKGFADVSVGGAFIVKGFRIVQGKNGIFIGMPQQQGKDGRWYNVAYPVTKEMRQQISEIVLEAYSR